MDDLMYEGVLILMETRGFTQVGRTSFETDGETVMFENGSSLLDYALNSNL
jgi:hypothetical protein